MPYEIRFFRKLVDYDQKNPKIIMEMALERWGMSDMAKERAKEFLKKLKRLGWLNE